MANNFHHFPHSQSISKKAGFDRTSYVLTSKVSNGSRRGRTVASLRFHRTNQQQQWQVSPSASKQGEEKSEML